MPSPQYTVATFPPTPWAIIITAPLLPVVTNLYPREIAQIPSHIYPIRLEQNAQVYYVYCIAETEALF